MYFRKKLFIPGVFLLSILSAPFLAGAHGNDPRVEIELESSDKVSAGIVSVEFQLVDTKENKVLKPENLNITHERKLHFLAYDPALKEFLHVHPEFDGNFWKVDLSFTVNGKYFIWAQGEIASDRKEFSALSRIEVIDGQNQWPIPPALNDSRAGSDGSSVATISNTKLRAGRMAMLNIKFTKNDGSPANITPYLGAFAHVVAVPVDGDSLLHVHPMDGAKPNEGMLHVTFPDAGFYRLWVQFIDDGVLKVIPLSVQVF